jgi:hypothetical protein
MRHKVMQATALCVALVPYAAVGQNLGAALGLVVYPSAGQTVAQQGQDESECYQWGRQTTGIDPSNPMAGVARTQPAPAGGAGTAAGGGAVRGATAGALIGNLADEDAGEYALAGAAIGSIRAARKAEKQSIEAQNRAAAQDQAVAADRVRLFKNAFGACMEGRKYTVK